MIPTIIILYRLISPLSSLGSDSRVIRRQLSESVTARFIAVHCCSLLFIAVRRRLRVHYSLLVLLSEIKSHIKTYENDDKFTSDDREHKKITYQTTEPSAASLSS